MLLIIDEGTTSTRALLISQEGEILGIESRELSLYYPETGWVEQDAEEIFNFTLDVSRKLIKRLSEEKKINPKDIKGISISNQRETTVLWDKRTGGPVSKAIVWQCSRTEDFCKKLKEDKSFSQKISAKTGLLIHPYFSATKIKWIVEKYLQDWSQEEIAENIFFGTIDSWLIWKLTNKHLTDTTNASRTMLFNILDLKWDKEILDYLNIPKSILPEVLPCNADFGFTKIFQDLCKKDLEIVSVMGDQQAALYAYGSRSEAKATYGTGIFVLVPCGTRTPNLEKITSSGLLVSPAFHFKKADGDFNLTYAIEGSILNGGSIVQWLRDGLGIIKSSSEIEDLAKSVESSDGVILNPAFVGLGAPFWDSSAKASIQGLHRGSTKGHIARAALDAMAKRVKDIFDALDPETRASIKFLNADGGASRNKLLMEIQSQMLGIPVRTFKDSELTALGVAKASGLINYEPKLKTAFN
jgi:glycerol kinase